GRFLRKTRDKSPAPKSDPRVANKIGRCHARHPNVVTIPNHSPIGVQIAKLRTRSLRRRVASSWRAVDHTMKAPHSPPHTSAESHSLAVPMPVPHPVEAAPTFYAEGEEHRDQMFDWRYRAISRFEPQSWVLSVMAMFRQLRQLLQLEARNTCLLSIIQ